MDLCYSSASLSDESHMPKFLCPFRSISAELSFLSFSVQEVVAVSTTAVSSSLGAVPNSSSGAKDVCCRIDYFILSN